MGHRHHFDLLKQLLAQHAGRIAPALPASERKHREWAVIRRGNAAASKISPATVLVSVTSKWGSTTSHRGSDSCLRRTGNCGANHAFFAHSTGVFVSSSPWTLMVIEHELGERAVQPRDRSAQHHEARA